MQPFTDLSGVVLPIDRRDVDTDALLPKQFMATVVRTGLGPYLFDGWRYLDIGHPGQECAGRPRNTACVLNDPCFAGASIMLARENFGCGSSREHAPWALMDYGIRVIVAPSFGDIFRGNCLKNGLLPLQLPAGQVDQLFNAVARAPGQRWQVSLLTQELMVAEGESYAFHLDAFERHCLLNGLDEISLTLEQADSIRRYEEHRREQEPWLFG